MFTLVYMLLLFTSHNLLLIPFSSQSHGFVFKSLFLPCYIPAILTCNLFAAAQLPDCLAAPPSPVHVDVNGMEGGTETPIEPENEVITSASEE